MDLESLFNNIITSGIKISDPETIRKIKTLNIFQLVFIMFAPLLGLFYFYIGAIFLFYVIIIAGLLMIPSILLLRKTKNIVLIGNYAIFVVWATILIFSWNTGAITPEGVIMPLWILNAGLILLAIFLNGYFGGTLWATLVFLETGLVVYLFRTGYSFPNLIPAEISPTYSLGIYSICLLVILVFAFLFEKGKNEALIREREKSHAVRESQKYIDDILARSPTPTFILDKSHRVIQWNRACQAMTGVPAEEMLGKEVWEGFTINEQGSMADMLLEDPEMIMEKYNNASKTESGWFELEMFLPKLKGGQQAVVTVAPIFDNSGIIRGAIQTIQEIKDLHHDYEPDAMEKGAFTQVEESFNHPMFKVDSKGKISFWNRACEENFGYTASQVLGRSPFRFVSKRYRPVFRSMIVRAFNGESVNEKECKYYNSEKKPVYVLAKVYPSKVADGKGKECVIINTDITKLKLRIKKLEVYAVEIKEKLKTLSEEYALLKQNIAAFIRKKDE
jgi:PAS domain S-box-containing protein